jgi:hypothetical protein
MRMSMACYLIEMLFLEIKEINLSPSGFKNAQPNGKEVDSYPVASNPRIRGIRQHDWKALI